MSAQVSVLLQYFRRILGNRYETGTDGTLLERFNRCKDEEAFAALLQRHGRLVWNVSRRVTRHEQDAEDVFQATFLLLARKAQSIRKKTSVASWLYGVAYRLALRTRCDAARRRQHEEQGIPSFSVTFSDEITLRELRGILDEELARLPDKYRAPLLLCYFEELTQEEAARHLGWSKRSVKDRLERGRRRLRSRLAQRGVTFTVPLAVSALAGGMAKGASSFLTETTIKAAVVFALGRTLPCTISAGALALTKGGLKTMFVGKLLLVASMTAVFLGGAGILLSSRSHEPGWESIAPVANTDRGRVDRYGDPLPPGAVVRLGTVRFRFFSVSSSFLPDGKTAIAAEPGGGIKLWDPRTGRLVREIDTGHFMVTRWLERTFALSRDGQRLAVSGTIHDGNPWRAAVAVFDLRTGKMVRLIERSSREGVNGLTMSPDGKMLFTLDRDGKLRVEEVATGAELLRQQFPGDVSGNLAISPDGSLLALASGPNTCKIYVWKWQAGEEPRECGSGWDRGREVVFSPDGKLLAECSDSEPDVRLLDVATGREVRRLELPDHEPFHHCHLAFAPNGKLLAAYGISNEQSAVHLWEPTTGKFVKRLPIGGALAFSPDSTLLIAGSDVWDFAADKELSANDEAHHFRVNQAATGPKDVLISASEDNTIRVWDAATGKQHLRWTKEQSLGSYITAMALSPDGMRLISSTMGNDEVSLWDIATGKKIYRLAGHGRTGNSLGAAVFQPDGKAFLTWGAADMCLRKWDVRTGKALLEHVIRLPGLLIPREVDEPMERERLFMEFGPGEAQFSRDARWLVLHVRNKWHLFETATGTCLRSFPAEGAFMGLAISPDGKVLLASAFGEKIRTNTKLPGGGEQYSSPKSHTLTWWSFETGELRKQVSLPEENPGPVAFSPDGKLFAAASSRPGTRIRLMETATGREVRRIEGFQSRVCSLVFLPDGQRLVSGLEDSTALIWDLTQQ